MVETTWTEMNWNELKWTEMNWNEGGHPLILFGWKKLRTPKRSLTKRVRTIITRVLYSTLLPTPTLAWRLPYVERFTYNYLFCHNLWFTKIHAHAREFIDFLNMVIGYDGCFDWVHFSPTVCAHRCARFCFVFWLLFKRLGFPRRDIVTVSCYYIDANRISLSFKSPRNVYK